jgi:hypothetical protein
MTSVSELLVLLERYANKKLGLEALRDELSLGLQEFFDKASEEDMSSCRNTFCTVRGGGWPTGRGRVSPSSKRPLRQTNLLMDVLHSLPQGPEQHGRRRRGHVAVPHTQFYQFFGA